MALILSPDPMPVEVISAVPAELPELPVDAADVVPVGGAVALDMVELMAMLFPFQLAFYRHVK
jgi:hypothetical protein